MNKSKLFLVGAFAAVSLCAFAAQRGLAHRPAMMGGMRQGGGERMDPLARLTKELNLDAHQQQKLRPAFDAFRSKMMGLRGNPGARTQMDANRQALEHEIRAVLNASQKKKFEQMGGLRGIMGFRGGMGFMRDLDQLNLTAHQKHQLQPILDSIRKQMEAMRSSGGPGEGGREKMRAMFQNYRAQIDKILTKEQREKLAQLRAQRGGPGGGARP